MTAVKDPVPADAFGPLDSSVRCDRCGAQAYVRVRIAKSGLGLDFCKHHYDKHEPEVRKVTDAIMDRRQTIT